LAAKQFLNFLTFVFSEYRLINISRYAANFHFHKSSLHSKLFHYMSSLEQSLN